MAAAGDVSSAAADRRVRSGHAFESWDSGIQDLMTDSEFRMTSDHACMMRRTAAAATVDLTMTKNDLELGSNARVAPKARALRPTERKFYVLFVFSSRQLFTASAERP